MTWCLLTQCSASDPDLARNPPNVTKGRSMWNDPSLSYSRAEECLSHAWRTTFSAWLAAALAKTS